MTETLSRTPSRETEPGSTVDVDQAMIDEINSIDTRDDRALSPAAERLQAATDRVRNFLERRAVNKAHGQALKENERLNKQAQNEAFASYEENLNYTETKEKLIDPRSRLRKIGDKALGKMEKAGGGKTAKLLEAWGIIPVIGTRHKQRGLNFSAWVARKYVKAQKARKNREERITAGFLSPEAKAQLNAMWEPEEQPAPPSPEKIAQDAAYESYQENIDATAKREQEEKEAQDSAFETYQDNVDATAKREAQEDAFKSYEENIDTTAKREAQDTAFASYQDNIDATAAREQTERDNQRAAYDTYAENIDTTAKRELQEATYASYADNIDTTAKREAQESAFASYEENIEATAERERNEAHARAEAARTRRERRPLREHATNLKERISKLSGKIGTHALALLRRMKIRRS